MGIVTVKVAARDIRIQINRVLRKAAVDNRAVGNLRASQVRVVRVVLLGAPSVRAVFDLAVGGEVAECGRPRPQQITPDRTALAFFYQRGLQICCARDGRTPRALLSSFDD
jgi:hypothetical protein